MRSALLAAALLTLGTAAPAQAAAASGEHHPEATVTWPQGPVTVGDPASVTVTGTDLDPATPAHVYLRASDRYASSDGRLLASADLTTDSTAVRLALPTDRVGTRYYYVLVASSPDGDGYVNEGWGTVRVVGRPSTVTARFPHGSYPAHAHAAPVTGSVSGTPGRVVQVQAKGRNGTWVPLADGRTRANRTFSIAAPTWWVARQTLRAYAPGTRVDAAAASRDTGSITVTRSYKPRGGTAFKYVFGSKGRWNPCHVVDYRVNHTRLPAGGLARVRAGFRAVSEATGLRFRYVGRTRFTPYRKGQDSMAFPHNADFVIAWAPPRVVPRLAGSTVGVGGAFMGYGNGRLYNGGVAFDSTARLSRAAWASVVIHEFGHAVGLGHVNDKRQIMYPSVQHHAAQYAAGDLRGLAAVGAGGGCLG